MANAPWTACAARSRELDEALGGTAARATGWVCVEHRGSWSPGAPSAAELGTRVTAALDLEDVRVQLIRRPRRAHTPEETVTGPLTVLLAHAAVRPDRRWVRRIEVDDHEQLPTVVDPASTRSPRAPAVGEPVDGDVWLVCAHGRRDACCAVHGRPVAAALRDAGAEVWETTHTGGHRFAATAVLLPDGLSLGRLDTVEPTGLAAELADHRLPAALLRGRCGVPRPAQAAEAFARAELDVRRRDDLLPVSWELDDGTATVVLDGPAGRHLATVRTVPATPARAVSDGADPTTPDAHVLVALRPAP